MQCQCPPVYKGKNCEIDINECEDNNVFYKLISEDTECGRTYILIGPNIIIERQFQTAKGKNKFPHIVSMEAILF